METLIANLATKGLFLYEDSLLQIQYVREARAGYVVFQFESKVPNIFQLVGVSLDTFMLTGEMQVQGLMNNEGINPWNREEECVEGLQAAAIHGTWHAYANGLIHTKAKRE